MLSWALPIATALLGVAMLLNLWRLLAGPDTPDRILALDTLYANAIGLILLYGIWAGSTLVFEAALLIAVLGFVGTVALSRFVVRRDIIE
ncbi:MAG: K+/H+ antiporter subunit F [Burkholderiales bacterium]|nr:K+/H+ antiporter subunit F [Burkholderiales bacterium]